MENQDNMNVCHGGVCGGHGCMPHHGMATGQFFAFRLFLGLIILAIVFWMGVKVGELKGSMDGYGYGDFYGRRGMMNQYYQGGLPMMRYNVQPTTQP